MDQPGSVQGVRRPGTLLAACAASPISDCLLAAALMVLATVSLPQGNAAPPAGFAPSGAQSELQETKREPRLIVQLGHVKAISRLLFSPDQKLVLTSDSDVDVLWDIETGREIRRWRKPESFVDFSPDGKCVITMDERRICNELNLATGQRVRQFTATVKADDPSVLRFRTTEGIVLRALRDGEGKILLVHDESGKQLRELVGHSLPVWSLAVSSSGKQLLSGSADATARLWDVASGVELRRFAGVEDWVEHVAFGPEDKTVLTSDDRTTRIWDIHTGALLRSFAGRLHGLFPGGKLVITATREGVITLWDPRTGAERKRLAGNAPGTCILMVSPDGKRLLATGPDETRAQLWELDTALLIRRFAGYSAGINAVAFSANGRRIVTGSDDHTARLWDTLTGRQYLRLEGHGSRINCTAFSPDGSRVVTGSGEMLLSPENSLRLWDAATGQELRRLIAGRTAMTSVAFSPQGHLVAGIQSADDFVRLWNIETGAEERRFGPLPGFEEFTSVAFSPDGKWVAAGSWFSSSDEARRGRMPTPVHLWEVATGKPATTNIGTLTGVDAVAFAPDGSQLMAGLDDGRAKIFHVQTGEEVGGFPFDHFDPRHRLRLAQDHDYAEEWRGLRAPIQAVAIAPNGKSALTAGWDGTARLWDVATGDELRRFDGHSAIVSSLAFSPDGKWVLTGSRDGTTRLWEAATGKELCRIVSFREGGEAVIAPDGRFDVGRFDDKLGIHWLLPDGPLRPLPVDVFLRDYYEPRLLARLLAGERFPPIRDLTLLNTVQPKVEIKQIEPEAGRADRVRLSVEVTESVRELERDGASVSLRSGAFDVRLFRDGRLLRCFPDEGGPVPLDAQGGTAIQFRNVQLPCRAGQRTEFAVYAFNGDHVKSETHRQQYLVPMDIGVTKPNAYVICVGVNAFDSPVWDLRFAHQDAQAMARVLQRTLVSSGQFSRVVVIPLLSAAEDKAGRRQFAERSATKENIRGVLRTLAGDPAPARLRQSVPLVGELREAQPEDVVILTFSTHGFRGKQGEFHLLPADIGQQAARRSDEVPLERTISTDELSRWLRDVDAGHMVIIVDACFSASSVEQADFKPGPMDSRGFGQLAYDKRMRVLAASQAFDVAFEDARIGHGLLTYALIHEGLGQRLADVSPVDQHITLGEWLRYGASRVPAMLEEIAAGRLHVVRGLEPIEPQQARRAAQRPALFDFTAEQTDLVLQ